MLTESLANEIVTQTMIRLNRNINIMDENGIILASGDSKRIHQVHFGAIEVLRSGKPLVIDEQNIGNWEGVRPGINLPIIFQGKTIGVIGITGKPEETLEFGELVKMITEIMIQQAFITEQVEWKQRLKELIFTDLLSSTLQIESIDNKLQMIGFKLESPFQVAIIELGNSHLKKNDLLQVVEDLFPKQRALIGFIKVNRLFILTLKFNEQRFKEKCSSLYRILATKNPAIRIGIGLSVIETESIRHSYKDALSALKHSSNDQPIVTYAEIETKALFDHLDERTKQQFSNRILGNLSEKLIETLECFFMYNLNIEKCSRAMYIHRNSLIYRLKQIKEITSYDPQNVHDVITLQMAIWLRT